MHYNYYEVLGLSPDANINDIKKAYYKLAHIYHPDKNNNDSFYIEKFKLITKAYQTLSNVQKKHDYDQKNQQKYKQDSKNNKGFSGFSDGFWNLFKEKPNKDKPTDKNNKNYHDIISIAFSASYTGCQRTIYIPQAGSSKARYNICTQCGGGGFCTASGLTPFRRQCIRCSGTGKIQINIDKTNYKISVDIPAGINDGDILKIPTNITEKPFVNIKVSVLPDDRFSKKGNDLFVDIPVRISSVLLGDNIQIPLPYGLITIKIPPQSKDKQVFRIKDKGFRSVKNTNDRGHLYVTINLTIPKKIPNHAIEMIKELKKTIPDF